MNISMPKVFVTGGNGQLAYAYSQLISSNSNLSYMRKNYNVHILSKNLLDITNLEHFKSYIKKNGEPDIIINCAAMTNVDKAELNSNLANEINAFSIKKILSHFNGLFIQISTDYVFDGEAGGYLSTDIPNPINAYGASKSIGEQIVQDFATSWIIIRAGGLFSMSTANNFYAWVINSIKRNELINVVEDQVCNPVSTTDVAQYIYDIQNNDLARNKICHIGSNRQISKYNFALEIAKAWGFDSSNINPISTAELIKLNYNYIAQRPKNSSLDLSGENDKECNLNDSIELLRNY